MIDWESIKVENKSSPGDKAAFKTEKLELFRLQEEIPTGYPEPVHHYRLVYEILNQSIENNYFWIYNYMLYDQDYIIEKIYDIFTASEQSSFFGAAQARLSIQQDRISNFLATVGKMVKELFQLVRELRIIDERLSYYYDSYDTSSKSRESAEITLKGIFVDMVEGGAKSTSSVYGMAREIQFAILPDLFFKMHPHSAKDVDQVIDELKFNRKVREVLKRKLRSFLAWKEHTFKELQTKRIFTLKFLRQHFDIIKMYMAWVRPYLRNVQLLQMADKTSSPELINAFEGALIEIEILCRKKFKEQKYDRNGVVILNFSYRASPQMDFHQEGFQHKGPVYHGKTEINFLGYIWTTEEIEAYKKARTMEDLELLAIIDNSLAEAMSGLGEELDKYLEEAGEKLKKRPELEQEKLKPHSSGPMAGLIETFWKTPPKKKIPKKPAPEKPNPIMLEREVKKLTIDIKQSMYNTYKNFKRSHKMLTW